MIFLYTILVVLFGAAHFLLKRRAAALEKKYTRVAKEADTLLRQTSLREGNSSRADPYQAAKRQYQLGRLAQKRDRVEARYNSWQGAAERTGKLVAGLKNWKGKKLPYTFGVLDVAAALALVDYLGFGQYANIRYLIQVLTPLFNG
jgi:hypothetical protein